MAGTAKEKALEDTSPQDGAAKEAAQEAARAEVADNSATEEAAAKAKAKTKGHIAKAFKKVSRKLAGLRGDVSVAGKEKKVSKHSGLADGRLRTSLTK